MVVQSLIKEKNIHCELGSEKKIILDVVHLDSGRYRILRQKESANFV